MRGLEVVDRHLRALEAGDAARLERVLADGFRYIHSAHPRPLDKTTYIRMVRALHAALPDWTLEETDLEEDGDHVHGTLRVAGTHTGTLDLSFLDEPVIPPAGRRVNLPDLHVRWRLIGDKVAQLDMVAGRGAYAILDALGLTREEGQVAQAAGIQS